MSRANNLTRMTIRRDIDDWTDHLKAAGLSPETIYLRTRHVRRVLQEIGRAPGQITHDELIAWLGKQNWAAQTRRSYRASLQQFYKWWEASNRGDNIAESLPRTKAPRAIPRPAEDADILQALRSAPPRVQLMIELMAYGGLRRAEVARVKTSDLHGEWLEVTGKGGHTRLVPLPPHLCHTIRTWPHRGWLFPGATNAGHLTPAHVGKLVGKRLPEGVTPHKLRHRFASVVYRTSHDIRAVQELLGHAKLDTTMVYVALEEEARLRAAGGAWALAAA